VIHGGANNMHYIGTDYTGGMPSSCSGGNTFDYEVTMRCGVDPYVSGPDISQKRIVLCG
jgi:hypothetical protein